MRRTVIKVKKGQFVKLHGGEYFPYTLTCEVVSSSIVLKKEVVIARLRPLGSKKVFELAQPNTDEEMYIEAVMPGGGSYAVGRIEIIGKK